MIIDEDIVAGGVTPFIITKLIERHERERRDTDYCTITTWRPPHFSRRKRR